MKVMRLSIKRMTVVRFINLVTHEGHSSLPKSEFKKSPEDLWNLNFSPELEKKYPLQSLSTNRSMSV